MGPIVDRTKENLVSTDNGIIMARHRLRKAVHRAARQGRAAAGPHARASAGAIGRAGAAARSAVQGRDEGRPDRAARRQADLGLTRCRTIATTCSRPTTPPARGAGRSITRRCWGAAPARRRRKRRRSGCNIPNSSHPHLAHLCAGSSGGRGDVRGDRGPLEQRAFPDLDGPGQGRSQRPLLRRICRCRHPDGSPADLNAEIDGADVVVLLATTGESEGAAEVIARECFNRKIMCAGLALGAGRVRGRRGPGGELDAPVCAGAGGGQ